MCTEAKDRNPIDYDKLITDCRNDSIEARKEIILYLKKYKRDIKNLKDTRDFEIREETAKIKSKYNAAIRELFIERDEKRKKLIAFEKKRGVNLKRLIRQKKKATR